MIQKWTDKVVQFFLNANVISENEIEIYNYGVKILLFQMLVYWVIGCLAICFDKLLTTIAYYSGFLPVRYVAGGFHASTHLKCFFVTISLYIIAIAICAYMQGFGIYCNLVIIILSIMIIVRRAPVDHKNRSILGAEKKRFKKKSIRITLFIVISIFLLANISFELSLAMSLGLLTASCSVLVGSVQRRKEEQC